MNEGQKSWPMLLDMTKEECKRSLRSLELLTYSQIVSVLRAQGEFTKEKRKLLTDLQMVFSISVERHRAEIRRAVNDEVLNTIAETLAGPNTNIEWAIEGRRLIPLMPRVPPQIAYTALATKMAQQYCGLNASLPDPCDTALYGKLDDVGAESDMTDSEEETEGLRFITESMIPPQYNINQGPYSVLPLSQARLDVERQKEKKDSSAEEYSQDAPGSPQLSSSISSGNSASNGSHGKAPPSFGAERRKRKRSFSFDHPPAHSPPPPPLASTAPTSGGTPLSTQTHNAPTTIWQPSPTVTNSSMKITMTGGMTRSSSASPLSMNSQQKVILVSTSAASGSAGNIYQRSISVPILKSPQGGPGSGVTLSGSQISQGSLLRCPVATSATSVSGNVSIMNKLRPRFSSSISTSILSTGSSSLTGLTPRPSQRQRSNSLILQTEGELPASRLPSASSTAQSMPSDNFGNSLNFIGSNVLQLRSNPSIAPKSAKSSNIQVKQEAGKLITHSIVANTAAGSNASSSIASCSSGVSNTLSNVVGGRIIGRTTLPSSSQGLYMVSTSSGTITVVTRTVASASISNPRVVTVNTINNSRSSIVRGSTPSTPGVTLGATPKTLPPSIRPGANIRPVMSGPKSNVIVVHKGTIATGGRPVGIQGLRDLSTKIISKSTTPGPSGSSGLLSGTLIVKPSPVSAKGATTSLVSTTKESMSSATSNSCTSNISSSSSLSAVGNGGSGGGISSEGSNNNLIVVDLSRESSLGSQNAPAALANILHTPGIAPVSGTKNGSTASHSFFGNKVFLEANTLSSQSKKEPHHGLTLTSSSSHDISTVSASSSLPSSFRSVKTSPDNETIEETTEVAPCVEKKNQTSFSNIVSSSSDVKEVLEESLQEQTKVSHEIRHPSFSLREDEVDEEDNEWLKLGLEEDEVEMDEEEDEEVEEEERSSEISSCTEKSTFQAEDSLENEVEDKTLKSVTPPPASKEREEEKSAASEPSVSSSTEEPAVEKEEQLQMLVEKAVEVLKGGDSDQARSLLYKAGFELIDSSCDPNQAEAQDGFSISNIAGVSSSSGILGSTTPLSASTPLRDESSLGSMSELDPATGYFYSPAGENSSERASNKADSPASKEEDSLSVPESEEN